MDCPIHFSAVMSKIFLLRIRAGLLRKRLNMKDMNPMSLTISRMKFLMKQKSVTLPKNRQKLLKKRRQMILLRIFLKVMMNKHFVTAP